MSSPAVGDFVHTPLGKGVVRELRGGGRLVVVIGSRRVVVAAADVTVPVPARRTKKTPRAAGRADSDCDGEPVDARPAAEVDLHGCTVDEAMERAMSAIDSAIMAGRSRLRVIHGRSGGRIRVALHARLGQLPPVRAFRLDPANAGVTIVDL